MVLPKNAKHACCIVSFLHFHEARAVLHYNGVKPNISPQVLQHAENIVNNPLLVRSGKKNKTPAFTTEKVLSVCEARHDVGLLSSLRGQRQEKNGYRSEMSPGGGPACARCQEASSAKDSLHLELE